MWLKGNLHTHTTNSDGDSPPDVVAAWYRDHGYDFLSLTDHNVLTQPQTVSAQALGDMFLIPGEEVTMELSVHVNAINVGDLLEPPRTGVQPMAMGNVPGRDDDKLRLLRDALERIHRAGAIASVNHPNYQWCLSPDLIGQLEGLRFFEVFNGHPQSQNDGDQAHAGTERIWDHLLLAGKPVYALATDDAHHLKNWAPSYSNPGRGWVMVDAPERTPLSIQRALERGAFYASSGVTLEALEARRGHIEVAVRAVEGESYTLEFVSDGGVVVDRRAGASGCCEVPAGKRYLRAVVRASSGARAWVQPTFRET